MQEFQSDNQSEASICRSETNNLRDDLYRTELTSNNPWKDLTAEVLRIK